MGQPGWEASLREWIHVCAPLNPFAVHLQLSQHNYLAMPHYKIRSLQKSYPRDLRGAQVVADFAAAAPSCPHFCY